MLSDGMYDYNKGFMRHVMQYAFMKGESLYCYIRCIRRWVQIDICWEYDDGESQRTQVTIDK